MDVNWLDLFRAADRFLVAIVEQNVVLVYVTLFLIFFSETGLVVMAFLPGDSLLFVAGAVSALPAAQAKGLNVHMLAALIIEAVVFGMMETTVTQRSTSPNTMSSEPRMADTSASICPRVM